MKRASQENGPKPHQELLNEPPTETGEELAEIYNNKKLPKRYENVSKVKRERVEKVLEAVLKGSPIREACAMVGMSVSTFYRFRRHYDWIREAHEDLIAANTMIVEDRLFRSAIGYDVEEVDIKQKAVRDEKGKLVGNIERTEHRKRTHYHPNVTAMIFVLKNRSGGKWRSDHNLKIDVNHTGDGAEAHDILLRKRIRDMSDEELEQVRAMGKLLLDSAEGAEIDVDASEVDES